VGCGVPEPVGPEPVDAGACGAATQGTAESFAAETLPSVAEPQVAAGRHRVMLALVEVDQQRLGGRLPDRNHSASSALAAADGDHPCDEVEVVELEVDELPGADGVSNMSGMMA
jgi:hypothetical protein